MLARVREEEEEDSSSSSGGREMEGRMNVAAREARCVCMYEEEDTCVCMYEKEEEDTW